MQVVDKPTLFPAVCFLSGSHVGPMVDLQRDIGDHALRGGRMYLRISYVEQLGRAAGMLTGAQADAMSARIAELEGELAALKAELEEQDRFASAIDVIESKDFRARRKAGRPPRKKEPSVAS